MKYYFTTLTTTILCLLLIVFAGESHAQYNSAYDSKGNVKSVETRRYEESRNNQNKTLNSNNSSNNRSSYNSPAPESFQERWVREAPERAKRKAEEKAAGEAAAEASRIELYLRRFSYIAPTKDENGLRLVKRGSNGNYGYLNNENIATISDYYMDYKPVSEGYYALKLTEQIGWGFKDKNDSTVIHFQFDDVLNTFHNGIAKVVSKGRTVWIDKKGNEINVINKEVSVENKITSKNPVSSAGTKPATVTSTNKAKSKSFYNDGFAKYEREDFRNAITAFTNAVNADPENLEAWYYRAFAKYNLQDYTGAIADFNKIKHRATTSIGSSDIIYNLGLAKFKLKDYKSAIDDMTYAVRLNMRNANAYFLRAIIKSILNDDTGAIEDYTKVIAIDPGHIKAWLNRGNAKSKLHKYQEAILDFKQLTVIAPTNSHAWLYMANRKFDLQNYREALTDYAKVIELKNKETVPEAYYYRGYAKLLLNEKEAACVDLRMAVSLGHSDNDALISKNCN